MVAPFKFMGYNTKTQVLLLGLRKYILKLQRPSPLLRGAEERSVKIILPHLLVFNTATGSQPFWTICWQLLGVSI